MAEEKDPLKELLAKAKTPKGEPEYIKMDFKKQPDLRPEQFNMKPEEFFSAMNEMLSMPGDEAVQKLKAMGADKESLAAFQHLYTMVNLPEILHRLQLQQNVMEYFAERLEKYTELPADCKDAEGTPLQPGDRLTGGSLEKSFKEVLSVHFTYAVLSCVDKPTQRDVNWSEKDIKERGWKIDRVYAAKQLKTKV